MGQMFSWIELIPLPLFSTKKPKQTTNKEIIRKNIIINSINEMVLFTTHHENFLIDTIYRKQEEIDFPTNSD